MFDELHAQIRAHAAAEFPRECCGLVVRIPEDAGSTTYLPCRNNAVGTENFILNARDFTAAEDSGEVLAVVHSHPNESANPSMADRVMCEHTGLPWLIIGWPSGTFVTLEPAGFRAPLLGREFSHGVLDCYALCRDYYAAIGIDLPDFEREDQWWEVPGTELYLRNFESAGFVEVADGPRLHDFILIQVLSDQVNHAAVFIGDGHEFDALLAARGEVAMPSGGTQLILHHLYGRLSARDVYGGYWQRHTRKIVRHRNLIGNAKHAA